VDRFKRACGRRAGLLARIPKPGEDRMAVLPERPPKSRPCWGSSSAEVWAAMARRLYPMRRELDRRRDYAGKARRLRERLRRDSLGGLFEDKANGVVSLARGLVKSRHIEQRRGAL